MTKLRDEDISMLAGAIRREPGRFVFLTGQGMSLSAGIPSTSQLLSDIQQKFASELSALSPTELQSLTACMRALSAEERHFVLKPYFENPKINWAHIALACMIQANHVKQVLTINVDTILARACGLVALYPAIYDLRISPAIDFEYMSYPSLINLRGQGYSSLLTDIDDPDTSVSSQVKALMQYVMAHSNLVVLGYEGNMEPFFPQIVESYSGRRRIYWLGHQEDPDQHLEPLLKGRYQNLVRYFGGVDPDEFMLKLAQEVGCFPPDVVTNPARHVLNALSCVTTFPISKSNMKVNILEAARAKLRSESELGKVNASAGGTIGTTSELVRSGDLPSVSRNDNSTQVAPATLRAQAATEKTNPALKSTEPSSSGQPKQWTADHEARMTETQSTSACAAAKGDEAVEPDPETLAWAHFVEGYQYSELAEKSDADKNLRRACEAYAQAVRLKGNFVEALNNWGISLRKLGDLRQEEKFYTHAIHKYDLALKYKPDFLQALNNWAIALSELAKLRGDHSLYALSIEKYEQALYIQPDFYQSLRDVNSKLALTWKLTDRDEYLRRADDFLIQKAEPDLVQSVRSVDASRG